MTPDPNAKWLPDVKEWDGLQDELRPKLTRILENHFPSLVEQGEEILQNIDDAMRQKIAAGKPFVRGPLAAYARRQLKLHANARLPRDLPTLAEWNALYPAIEANILPLLRSRFQFLGDDIEDVLQDVYLKVCEKIRREEPFLIGTLERYAFWLAVKRAIDRVRRNELVLVGGAPADEEDRPAFDPSDGLASTPSAGLVREEHVDRRNTSLAKVIQRLCCRWEPAAAKKKSARKKFQTAGTKTTAKKKSYEMSRKENFERMLRGESADEIVDAVLARVTFAIEDLSEARKKIKSAIQKTQSECMDELVEQLQSPEAGSVFMSLGKVLALNNPDGNRQTKNLPVYFTSNELLRRYLFEESGALCPRQERLQACLARPDKEWPRDIHYHVVEGGCPLCQLLVEQSPQ